MPFLTTFDAGKFSPAFVISASHAGVLGSPPRNTAPKVTGAVTDKGIPEPRGFGISGPTVGCTSSQALPREAKMVWWGEMITGTVSSSFSEKDVGKRFNYESLHFKPRSKGHCLAN